ncbi:dTDP-4-amino-4,6-dideoxy-D-galactose acyltransferase [Peribacillus sp. B2I2]|uniref:GNAT family N-acetyltransferase n=1 Tax=Peribacillus sp. B2I2 TaxID=3156468 RepID=UPI0035118119
MNKVEVTWGAADDISGKLISDDPIPLSTEINESVTNIYIFLRVDNKLVELISLKKLEWDSNHFNYNIWCLDYHVNNQKLEPSMVNHLMSPLEEICVKLSIDILFCKVNTHMHSYIHGLENINFNLMDTLITFEHNFDKNKSYEVPDIYDFYCTKDVDHIAEIMKLSEQIYTTDRFHTDPNLDNKKCDELYSSWIENQSKDQNCDILILKQSNTLVGFVTCKHMLEGTSSIQLVGVHPDHQGKGIGKKLIKFTLNHYSKKLNKMVVGTQLNNLNAIRTYLSTGFKITTTTHSFHRRFQHLKES